MCFRPFITFDQTGTTRPPDQSRSETYNFFVLYIQRKARQDEKILSRRGQDSFSQRDWGVSLACEGFATRLPFADKTGAKTGFDGQGASCWEDQVGCGWQSSLPDLHQGPSQQGTQLGPYRDPGEPPALARNPIPAPTGRLQPGKMAALPVAGCLHGRVICLRTQATVDRGWRFAESAQAYPGMLLHVCGPGGAGGRASPSCP